MKNYLSYAESVLGLKQVLMPIQAKNNKMPEPTKSLALKILFIEDKKWNASAIQLFEKMREALKLPADKTAVIFADQMSESELQIQALSSERVVCFVPSIYTGLKIEHNAKFLVSSPNEMLADPSLKKQAWESLKEVLRSLS